MESILYLAHTQDDGALSKAALETLSAAIEIARGLSGAALTLGLVGGKVESAADAIAGCGAAKCLAVSGADFAISRYSTDAAAAEALARASTATIIIAPATARFSRALPGVAQRLQGRIDTNVTGLDSSSGELRVQRWYYRQRMMGTLSQAQRPWVILLSHGVYPAWSGAAAKAVVEKVDAPLSDKCRRTRVEGIQAPPADAQTIRPEANLLFVAGAGWTKKQATPSNDIKQAERLIKGFLEGSKASLGSSKSLVDLSSQGQEVLTFMSHLNQVGQTGSTPRHPRGLATCCHGEEPHVVGWRFVNERRAVNLDANCGWAHGKADVLYVADAFEVMSKVNQMLGK
jgi:electron transfer flavoprotein alpha subunit